MAVRSTRFQYQLGKVGAREDVLPYLPLRLHIQANFFDRVGLVDSGASVNVLPYSLGLQLGAVWEKQTVELQLGGNLAAVEARGFLCTATVASFPAVRLAFAWARTDDVPLILGQMNFFQEFEVCFFRAQSIFEIRPRRSPQN
jgi:hypothetical protein